MRREHAEKSAVMQKLLDSGLLTDEQAVARIRRLPDNHLLLSWDYCQTVVAQNPREMVLLGKLKAAFRDEITRRGLE